MPKRKTVPAPNMMPSEPLVPEPPASNPNDDTLVYLEMADTVQDAPPPADELPPLEPTPADNFPAGGKQSAEPADEAVPTITVPDSFLQVARARKCIRIQTSKSMTAVWVKTGAVQLSYNKLTPAQADSLKNAAIAAFTPMFYVQGVNGDTTTLVCK